MEKKFLFFALVSLLITSFFPSCTGRLLNISFDTTSTSRYSYTEIQRKERKKVTSLKNQVIESKVAFPCQGVYHMACKIM